jgi:hypothetical protein
LNDHARFSLDTFAAEIVDDLAFLVLARSPLGSGHAPPVTAPSTAGRPLITVHARVEAVALRPAFPAPPHAATSTAIAITIATIRARPGCRRARIFRRTISPARVTGKLG